MNTFWGLSATAWTAIYTWLTAGLLTVAVLAARYAKKQIEEAQRAHREATRPYVIVSVESTAVARHFFDLCVRNIGQRPAFNVEIDLDPPPISSDEVAGHEIANIKMLTEPVAMIAPAQEMRAFYDSHRERQKATDLPSNHRVTLKYRDSSGHVYQEYSVLDLEAMRGTTYLDEKTIHHVAKPGSTDGGWVGTIQVPILRPGRELTRLDDRQASDEVCASPLICPSVQRALRA